jgi:hypothetical protein
MTLVKDLATHVKSSICGPARMTLDIIFKDKQAYERAKNSGVISKELIARLYGIPKDKVVGIFFVEGPLAIKISVILPFASGDPECGDHYLYQQYAPLLTIDIP